MRLQLQGLTRRFPGAQRFAVDHFTVEIPSGTLLVLAGPSGSGKTTLLRLVAGLEHPDEGQILADGTSWNALPPESRPVAMVFQHGALFPHLTVRENLVLGLRLQKAAASLIATRLAETAAMLGLEPLLDRLPENLSGGERQRVALGRALMRRPRFLLLDEPMASLDAPLRRELRAEIVRLCRQWVPTIIWVTHDQEEALAVADALAVMQTGRLEQCGLPLDVYLRPANRFVAQFLGFPPVNLFSAQWVQQNGQWLLRAPAGWLCPPAAIVRRLGVQVVAGQAVEVGFRPETILARCGAGENAAVFESAELAAGRKYWRLRFSEMVLWVTAAEDTPPAVAGQTVQLDFDWERALWFDPLTSRRIEPAAA